MKIARLTAVALALVACRRASPPPAEAQVDAGGAGAPPSRAPAAPPAPRGASYVTQWANAARSSRVDVPYRAPTEWRRFASVELDGVVEHGQRLPPRKRIDRVLLPPGGAYVVAVFEEGLDCYDPAGRAQCRRAYPGAAGVIARDGDMLVAGGSLTCACTSAGAQTSWSLESAAGELLAAREGPDGVTAIAQYARSGYERNTRAERVEVQKKSAASLVFVDRIERTTARGAIREDGAVALATSERGLLIEGPDLASWMKPKRHLDTRLDFTPTEVSWIGDELALLSRPAGGATELHVIDATGRVLWTARVPFEASQPPVAAGDRVILAGRGLAAVADGSVVWQHASTVEERATAYADGSLAVAAGPELRFLAPDGTTRATFRTDDDAPLATPPAIGADGSVWVASDHAIYVAR